MIPIMTFKKSKIIEAAKKQKTNKHQWFPRVCEKDRKVRISGAHGICRAVKLFRVIQYW